MTILPIFTFAALSVCSMQVQAQSGTHQGQYQKNLKYKGPVTGDEIIYTLYLPPGHAKDKGPYPLIIFLHGAGGGNASSQVMQSYEAARKVSKIGNFTVVFPTKYGGTVWRDGAKDKRAETNVLKELLPYLEKEYVLTQDRSQRTICGFRWERPARHHSRISSGGDRISPFVAKLS
jgi:predicted peptidase